VGPPPVAERSTRVEATSPRRRGPIIALVAVVALAAMGYGLAAQLVELPVLNPDELRYTLAARALADGEWLNLRGHDYGYGPVYPLVLAPIVALAGDVESAYPVFKLANALLFALAAVPIYFLARRLLSPWWSVGVTALSVAIPSSLYTSLVLTESVSYLVASAGLLAVVLALEHPTVMRQLALLGVVAVAFATRAQFAALVSAFLAGAVLMWALDARRGRPRDLAVTLWPTLAACGVVAVVLLGGLVASRSSPEDSLGGYGDLWRGYDLVEVARFIVYHLAAWELYVFVVPFVVAPIILVDLLRAARRGSSTEGAFAAAFLTVNAFLVLITAAFASTPFGYHEIHDRYLFYVAPLWFVVFGVWLSRGLPRPRRWIGVGAALGLVLPATLPFGLVTGYIVIETVPTALWSWVWDVVEGTPQLDGRRALGLVVVALVALTAFLPRRLWPVLPAVVAAGFGLSAVLAWHRLAEPSADFVQADATTRRWVDDAVPAGARVTKVFLSPASCPYTELTRHALFLTEFFNSSIDRVADIDDSMSDGLPVEAVDVERDGELVLDDGEPLNADYVVTQPGIALRGRERARATGADLVLWRTGGPVVLADPDARLDELVGGNCG